MNSKNNNALKVNAITPYGVTDKPFAVGAFYYTMIDINRKECTKCRNVKSCEEFSVNKSKKDGLQSNCKDCYRKYDKQYHEDNKDVIAEKNKQWRENNENYHREHYENNKERYEQYRKDNREYILQWAKLHYKNNKEAALEWAKEYYRNNKEIILERSRQYYKNNKEVVRERKNRYYKKRLQTDPAFRLLCNLRRRVDFALNGNSKSASTMELIGCTPEFLREYIEAQFQKGMSWDNRGKIHIDHIRPCSSFDLTDPEQQKQCFHYSNLQPLWAKENLKKHSKITDRQFRLLL